MTWIAHREVERNAPVCAHGVAYKGIEDSDFEPDFYDIIECLCWPDHGVLGGTAAGEVK